MIWKNIQSENFEDDYDFYGSLVIFLWGSYIADRSCALEEIVTPARREPGYFISIKHWIKQHPLTSNQLAIITLSFANLCFKLLKNSNKTSINMVYLYSAEASFALTAIIMAFIFWNKNQEAQSVSDLFSSNNKSEQTTTTNKYQKKLK